MNFVKMNLKIFNNLLKISAFLFLFLIIFFIKKIFRSYNNSFKEGLENSELTMNLGESFCKTHSGFDLETSCNKLTDKNCQLTSCCIFTSDHKCVAGNQNGPLFNSTSKGKTKPLDFFNFQNKCYGEKCKI